MTQIYDGKIDFKCFVDVFIVSEPKQAGYVLMFRSQCASERILLRSSITVM